MDTLANNNIDHGIRNSDASTLRPVKTGSFIVYFYVPQIFVLKVLLFCLLVPL